MGFTVLVPFGDRVSDKSLSDLVTGGPKFTPLVRSAGYEADYARERKKADAERRVREKSQNPASRLVSAPPIPILDEANAGTRKLGNIIANAYRRQTGAPEVDSRAIYRAQMDADKASDARMEAKYPVTSAISPWLTGIAGGGPEAKAGEWLYKGVRAVAPKAGAAWVRRQAGKEAGRQLAFDAATPAGRWVIGAKQAAKAGAVQMGAYGAAAGDTPEERGTGLLWGLILGGPTGLAVHTAAPVVAGGLKTATGISKDLFESLVRWGRQSELSPRQAKAAENAVLDLATKTGLTPDKIRSEINDKFGGHEVTGAEHMGRAGRQQLGAVGRRDADVGQDLEALMVGRQADQGGRVETAFDKSFGVNPESAQGNIESIVERGRLAAPELAEAAFGPELPSAAPRKGRPPAPDVGEHEPFAPDEAMGAGQEHLEGAPDPAYPPDWAGQMPGVTSPELENLARLRSVRAGLGGARDIEMAHGRDWRGQSMGRVEVPEKTPQGAPDEAPDLGALWGPPAETVKGPRDASAGRSLMEEIARQGGTFSDTYPGADEWHIGKPYMPKFQNPASRMDLEDHAANLWEKGYFPGDHPPTAEQILAAIQRERLGDPVYPQFRLDDPRYQRGQARAQDEDARAQWDQRYVEPPEEHGDYMATEGQPGWEPPGPVETRRELGPDNDVPIQRTSGDYQSSQETPSHEPVYEDRPTMRTWDLARRAHDAQIPRDKETGQPLTRGDPKSAQTMAQLVVSDRMKAELIRLNPAYGRYLEHTGDYLATESAFGMMRQAFSKGRQDAVLTLLARNKGTNSKEAMRGAIASVIHEKAGSPNGINMKWLAAPNTQKMMRAVLGNQEADQFMKAILAEKELAKGLRMNPNTGSPTAVNLASDESLAGQLAGDLAGGVASAATGNVKGGIIRGGLRSVARLVAHGQTAGQHPNTLKEYGRILLKPSNEFAAWLKTAQGKDIMARVFEDAESIPLGPQLLARFQKLIGQTPAPVPSRGLLRNDPRARAMVERMRLMRGGGPQRAGRFGGTVGGQVAAQNLPPVDDRQEEPIY